MLVKANKSFRGRYGLIRAGSTFNCEPGYYSQLAKKGWVVEVKADEPKPEEQRDPGPDKNRNKPDAPNRAGKAGAANGGGAASKKGPKRGKNTEAPPAGGENVTSRSLRRDLPSDQQTLIGSGSGDSNPSTQASAETGSSDSSGLSGADCGGSGGE